jgi:hypothetical protein
MVTVRTLLAASLLLGVATAHAQSTVGELLDKGGKKLGKDHYAAYFPATIKYVWPDKAGEGELNYKSDGTVSGTEYHYASRTTSTAVGTWTVDDNGKWCIKKHLATWNRNTDVCWYSFELEGAYFGALSDTDRNARVVPAGVKK